MKIMGCIRMKGLAGCLLVFLAAFALVSCGDDNPASPDPTPTDEKGEVSFEISTEGGTGSGTGTSPIEVAQGDTLYDYQPEEQIYGFRRNCVRM